MCGRSKLMSYEGLEIWLGGLDSNQDRQSQSLQSYQLDDLPAEGGTNKSQHAPYYPVSHDPTHLI
jgi:hypothetical protein